MFIILRVVEPKAIPLYAQSIRRVPYAMGMHSGTIELRHMMLRTHANCRGQSIIDIDKGAANPITAKLRQNSCCGNKKVDSHEYSSKK